jgi:hypothetical protein
MNESDLDEATKKVRELRQKVADLLRDDKVSAAGADRLNRDADLLAAAIEG